MQCKYTRCFFYCDTGIGLIRVINLENKIEGKIKQNLNSIENLKSCKNRFWLGKQPSVPISSYRYVYHPKTHPVYPNGHFIIVITFIANRRPLCSTVVVAQHLCESLPGLLICVFRPPPHFHWQAFFSNPQAPSRRYCPNFASPTDHTPSSRSFQ